KAFFEDHCFECHDSDTRKGNLDLTALKADFANPEDFAKWVKVHDRVAAGEMPPKKKGQPSGADAASITKWLYDSLINAEKQREGNEVRTGVRRMTRSEYENTVRDLFDLPGAALEGDLPADGSAHGFDTNSEALDISHVNVAKYVEAADKVLDLAI